MTIVSVKIVVKNTEGKFLLHMRDGTEGISNPLTWGLWGGGVEVSDASPAFAAARELQEELGINAAEADLQLLGQSTLEEGKDENMYLYTKPLAWGQFVVNEGAGAAFFTKAEMQQIPTARSISRLLALNVI